MGQCRGLTEGRTGGLGEGAGFYRGHNNARHQRGAGPHTSLTTTLNALYIAL